MALKSKDFIYAVALQKEGLNKNSLH